MDKERGDLPERVGSLETSVRSLHEDFSDLKRSVASGFSDIQATISRSRETNWPVILSGLMLVGALYASAVRPIQNDVIRQEKNAETLALAVVLKEEKISLLRSDLVKFSSEIQVLQTELKSVRDFGSPVIDKRLTVLEFRLDELKPPPAIKVMP